MSIWSYFHDCFPHLHPFINVMIEPHNANGVPSIQITVMAMFVPPTGRVKLGAVSAAHVIIPVHCAKWHKIRIS